MTTRIQAIYEKGVFRPSAPLPIADGSEVELVVTAGNGSESLAEALAKISELPIEGPSDGFSGADHDRVLYGNQPK